VVGSNIRFIEGHVPFICRLWEIELLPAVRG